MRRIQVGIGGLLMLWAIGIAIWAAVALAQIARGETAMPSRAVAPLRGALVVSLAPSSASPASSALFDVEGRRVVAEGIGSFDPGPRGVPFAKELSPGACRLMLRRQGAEGETRMVVLH